MSDEIYVEMPAEVAERLTSDGFDEVISFRGFVTDAYTVLTMAPAGLAVAANMATVLVSRDSVKELIDEVRAWMTRRTGRDPGSEFVVEISARSGKEQTTLRLTSRRNDHGGMPPVDTSALTSLVESMFANLSEGPDGQLPPAP